VILGRVSESLPPGALPPAHENIKAGDRKGLELGTIALKVAGFANEAFAYVPNNYDPTLPCGLLILLEGQGGMEKDKLLAVWKPLCDRYELILLVPKAADPHKWTPAEMEFVIQLAGQIQQRYKIDPLRVVIHGHAGSGVIASMTAYRHRELIRGLAVVDAVLPAAPPSEDDEPISLSVYAGVCAQSASARPMEKSFAPLRELGIPVTVKKIGGESRYLLPDELAEMVRWIDMLDRM
jgi:poly(3-hydroxybutyrate) depolymerase